MYIRRYVSASEKISSGVFIRARRGFETSSPKAARITPKITDERTAVPADRLTIRADISPLVPTAASAPFSPKRPIGGISGIKKLLYHACEKYGQSKYNYFSCKGTV